MSYSAGMCDVFALALHRLLGWPLAVVRGAMEDEWGEDWYEDAHAFVLAPEGGGADVRGIRPIDEIVGECAFSNPSEVSVVEVGEKEMCSLFTVEGVSEEDIDEAVRYAGTLPWVVARLV